VSAIRVGVVSDIHYAGSTERALGNDFELRAIANPVLRFLVSLHRRFVWLHNPLEQNYLLDRFLGQAGSFDYVVGNGDFTCDCASVGVSDDAAFQSAKECLDKLRQRFNTGFRATYGDHDLGKLSFFGGRGGMRLASWRRGREELNMEPFWQLRVGKYVLIGVVSSLIALPIYEPDTLPNELGDWNLIRKEHLAEISAAFEGIHTEERVLLFCHDPTALPFLWREENIRKKISQIEQTIIGHLHSNLILRKSRLLAGMPEIGFLGHSPRRMTRALREARYWRPFRVRLCPALAGIELLKDGGYLSVELDEEAKRPAVFKVCRVPR
jgi:hypothetical protein